jgi:pyroglutamyl-peptidase
MLRRRKKDAPREERKPSGQGVMRSRRRARPGAEVPPALKLPEPVLRELTAPVQGKGKTPTPALPKGGGSKGKTATPVIPQGDGRRKNPTPALLQGGGSKKSKRPWKVVLVTGFEPFGGEAMNPSWEICERLAREISGYRVETCLVPCAFRDAIDVVADAIERHRPLLVLSLGQAGGRTAMGVERVAINVDDARIADNAGAQPVDAPIAPDGPAAHFATVPVKAMAAAIRSAGVPAEVSNTAGTFVCNHLMYGVLHFIAARGHAARAGFIHVPYAEEQVLDKPGVASMSVASMVKAVEAAVAAALMHSTDIAVAEGRLD